MQAILRVSDLSKAYASGFSALKQINLSIRRGEIFALLGPNGAGKTTLINIVCGIVTASVGEVLVDGKNWQSDFRHARSRIGLVPQELSTEAFESVWGTVSFSRGLYGKAKDDAKIEQILRRLTLWDKRKARMMELSGGMKRRVMIAKALSHEPAILFLDEPTAGVDVELRRDMLELVRKLRADGTTVILTTHYIEEAEEMADRVGVIRKGELVALGDTAALMKQMGKKTLKIAVEPALETLPGDLGELGAELEDEGHTICYRFDSHAHHTGISTLMRRIDALGVEYKDLSTHQWSLEVIFVSLVHAGDERAVGLETAGEKSA
jgi:ABC-2 type transport system ATP-binding protein